MEIRVEHELSPDAAMLRVRAAAERLDVEIESDGAIGTLTKLTPLGSVRARFEVLADAVLVHIDERPAWLPEQTARSMLEDGLRSALADG